MSKAPPIKMTLAEQVDYVANLYLSCLNVEGRVAAETWVLLKVEDVSKLECIAGFLERLQPHARALSKLMVEAPQ